jgi:hypothetical protein
MKGWKMISPLLESMEPRLLLSAVTLAPGATVLFDTNGDGVKEGILSNTGTVALVYSYTAGNRAAPNTGLDYLNFAGNNGSVVTNMWAASVDDTGYNLTSAKLSVSVKYQSKTYVPLAGASTVIAGSIGTVVVGKGDLLGATATTGGIGTVELDGGNLYGVTAVGNIGTILDSAGTVTGSITTPGNLGSLSANTLTGVSTNVGGNIGTLAVNEVGGGSYLKLATADTIAITTFDGGSTLVASGSLHNFVSQTFQQASLIVLGGADSVTLGTLSSPQTYTSISFYGHVGTFQANTVTAGLGGYLNLAFQGGLDKFIVGVMDGGTATAANSFATTNVSLAGTLGSFQAGLVDGGTATGAGSSTKLYFNVTDLYDSSNNLVSAGDVLKLRASAFMGGSASDGADTLLYFNVSHDLVNAQIGQITGNGITSTSQPTSPCQQQDWCQQHYACQPQYQYEQQYSCQQQDQQSYQRQRQQPQNQANCDPSVNILAGHTIVNLVATTLSAGTVNGTNAYGDVSISAAWDIQSLTADTIDAGTALGDGANVGVFITAGHDIGAINANTFSGGTATGNGANAGLYVIAGRNIGSVAAGQIAGTQAKRYISDPTVQFIAGGSIGTIVAGTITGGTVTSDGLLVAESSVLIQAYGTYTGTDAGPQTKGDIGAIYAGTIRGGTASGAESLSHVNIIAANDVKMIQADTISGGKASGGGSSYVDILAEHDVVAVTVGTILGSEAGSSSGSSGGGCGSGYGGGGCGDSGGYSGGGCGSGYSGGFTPNCSTGGGASSTSSSYVQIQAYNNIDSIVANQIVAGQNGTVNILAGIATDANGNIINTGGDLQSLIVGLISGQGGVINIAAGGDIESLKATKIISGDGDINIVAGGNIDASVGSVQSTWTVQNGNGVQFSAGGVVNDMRNTIAAKYTSKDVAIVDLPDPEPATV